MHTKMYPTTPIIITKRITKGREYIMDKTRGTRGINTNNPIPTLGETTMSQPKDKVVIPN
jgi:hypothetical protein